MGGWARCGGWWGDCGQDVVGGGVVGALGVVHLVGE